MFRKLLDSNFTDGGGNTSVLDLDIIKNVDFDPMAILHEQGGKVNQPAQTAATVNQPAPPANPANPQQQQQPVNQSTNPQNVELTDEMIQAGLAKTKGVEGPKPQVKAGEQQPAGQPDPGTPAPTEIHNTAFKTHYDLMVQAGEWEPIENFDGTRDSYLKARDINNRRQAEELQEEFLREAFINNPEGSTEGKRLLRHLANGGKVSDFVALTAPQEFDFAAIENADENISRDASSRLIDQYYAMIGWTAEQRQARLNHLSKTGMLVDEAKQVKDPYQSLIKNRQAQHEATITQTAAARKEEQRKVNQGLLGLIDAGHTFGDLKLYETKKEREEIRDFFFSPSDNGKSEFANQLNSSLQDPQFLAFLGVALRKQLHKNPSVLSNGGAAANQGIDQIEETLKKALLNKNIGQNNQQPNTPAQNSNYKFNLDEAIVI